MPKKSVWKVWCLVIFTFLPLLFASQVTAEDYVFRDARGNEVLLPTGRPVYSRKSSGPWAGLSGIHEPKTEWVLRKEGLEDVRVLKLSFSHPSGEKDGRIERIYLADKDGYVVGYKVVSEKEQPVNLEFKLNGVINYLRIYVDCSVHGLWGAEMRL